MLEIRDVSFSYGKSEILSGINMSISRGEFVAVLGVNGAGKSTLVKIVSGYLKPQKGDVRLGGKSVFEYSPKDLSLSRAVLEQETNMEFDSSVLETVALGRFSMSGFWGMDDKSLKISKEALKMVGLDGFEEKMYMSLSGGEKRRVQLARAIAQILHEPEGKLLLLDEPTANLDPARSLQTMHICSKLCEMGASCMAVVHSVNLALAYAGKTLMLKDSKIFKFGDTAEVVTEENVSELYGLDCQILGDSAKTVALSLHQKALSH